MKSFPMFIRTSDRRVVIVGGGAYATQKARLMLRTDAHLVIVAAHVDNALRAVIDEGRATQERRLRASVFDGAAMAFVGTGCPGLDAAAHALARAARCPVTVVDRADLSDLNTPAIVDRDPLVVAIGSGGTSPVLTRDIKTKLKHMLPHNIGGLAALAGRLRASVNRRVPRAERRALWAWVFKGAPRDAWTRGQERDAARAITSAIDARARPDRAAAGHISLVGAGPGARDLLTLRAVERLQEADVIFYDRLVETDVLDLARRDARRVFVGKHVGAHSWPQDRINRVIVAEARRGKRVVRLKSGDPGVFGRATEEIEAARDAGIPVEIVPGVTAAIAAGAALGQSLTQRDVADVLILATGTGCASNPVPDATRFCAPGTTTAIYMGVRQAARLSRELMQKGLPASAPVDIAADVSKPGQTHLRATLGTLERTLRDARIEGGAVLLVTWPRQQSAHPAAPRPSVAASSAGRMPALAH